MCIHVAEYLLLIGFSTHQLASIVLDQHLGHRDPSPSPMSTPLRINAKLQKNKNGVSNSTKAVTETRILYKLPARRGAHGHGADFRRLRVVYLYCMRTRKW